jgi:DNA-binding CsgD family transcriptional regulator
MWDMHGRQAVAVNLGEDERRTLQAWAARRKTAQALALRSRIVLECAQGKTNVSVAGELRFSEQMVRKWRNRFARLRHGLAALELAELPLGAAGPDGRPGCSAPDFPGCRSARTRWRRGAVMAVASAGVRPKDAARLRCSSATGSGDLG